MHRIGNFAFYIGGHRGITCPGQPNDTGDTEDPGCQAGGFALDDDR